MSSHLSSFASALRPAAFVRAARLALSVLGAGLLAAAQTPPAPPQSPPPDDINDGALLWLDDAHPTLPFSFDWWGRAGRYYFVEQSEDLAQGWTYFPYAVRGAEGPEGVDFDTNATRIFLRLRHTDDPASDLLAADFDGDRVDNGAELRQGTDPFRDARDDGDSLPDDWEIFHLGTAALNDDADPDHDGYTLAEEFALFLSPTAADRDRAPDITVLPGEQDDRVYVDFSRPYPEGVLRFTLDGSEPTALSAAFAVAGADNRVSGTVGFAAPPAPGGGAAAVPAGCEALDTGAPLAITTHGSPEQPWVFGWTSALGAADFGQATLPGAGGGAGTVHDFVKPPLDNAWSFELPPGEYRVTLGLVPTPGQAFALALEGGVFDQGAVVAATEAGQLASLATELRVIDGALTLARTAGAADAVKLARLRVEFVRATPFSTGAPPFGSSNLALLRGGGATIKAAVFFADGGRSPTASRAVDLAAGLGAAREVYRRAYPLGYYVDWRLTTDDPATFDPGYAHFWLGRGWITAEGRFLPDPAFAPPAGGAFWVTADFGTTGGAKIGGFSYANASLSAAAAQGKAVLASVGARRIDSADTLAPVAADEVSAPVFFGELVDKRAGGSTRGYSTDTAVFTAGRYFPVGRGWIESAGVSRTFKPDTSVASATVYVGAVSWAETFYHFLSTDAARLRTGQYAELGRGWIEETSSGEFTPDPASPPSALFVGRITDGFFQKTYLAAGTTNLGSPQPVGSGWVVKHDAGVGAHSLVPDRAAASQPLYRVRPAGWSFDLLSTSATGAVASYGRGWITGGKSFEADVANQAPAPVYYGYVNTTHEATYSLTRTGLVEGGARVTSGRILAADRILAEDVEQTVYYAPVRAIAGGGFVFAYSNEAVNPVSGAVASEMGPGRIRAWDDVRMNIDGAPAMIHYGVVADASGAHHAYARGTAGFVGGRHAPVGMGHILAQGAAMGFCLKLESGAAGDLWYGPLSGLLVDNQFPVFRGASSFAAPPATPTSPAQYYFQSGGVTYYYAGRGRLLDARNYLPDLASADAPLYRGSTSTYSHFPLQAVSAEPGSLNFVAADQNGWAYAVAGVPEVLGVAAAAGFSHPADPDADLDHDGLSGLEEVLVTGTDPLKGDTDGDLVPDDVEVALGRDPRVFDDLDGDDDGDGVSNYLEYLNGTDPADADGDTDNDGFSDAAEIAVGSSPIDGAETPANLDPAKVVTLAFKVGDWSGSRSERYRVEVSDESGAFVYRLAARTHGEVVEGSCNRFRLGRRYRAKIFWEGTNAERADIDWVFAVSVPDSLPVHAFGPDGAFTFTGEQVPDKRAAFATLRDPLGLLGTVESG